MRDAALPWVLLLAVSLGTPTAGAEPSVRPIADVDEIYPSFDWHGVTVLHLGDSHVSAGLRDGLRRRLREAGAARYLTDTWVGSSVRSWLASGRLARAVREVRPGVVLITLGTNSLALPRPDRHATMVRALTSLAGASRCFWMGPPPIIPDRFGYSDMLAASLAPGCRFIDGRLLDAPPRADGRFHLSRAQGDAWAGLAFAAMSELP